MDRDKARRLARAYNLCWIPKLSFADYGELPQNEPRLARPNHDMADKELTDLLLSVAEEAVKERDAGWKQALEDGVYRQADIGMRLWVLGRMGVK